MAGRRRQPVGVKRGQPTRHGLVLCVWRLPSLHTEDGGAERYPAANRYTTAPGDLTQPPPQIPSGGRPSQRRKRPSDAVVASSRYVSMNLISLSSWCFGRAASVTSSHHRLHAPPLFPSLWRYRSVSTSYEYAKRLLGYPVVSLMQQAILAIPGEGTPEPPPRLRVYFALALPVVRNKRRYLEASDSSGSAPETRAAAEWPKVVSYTRNSVRR